MQSKGHPADNPVVLVFSGEYDIASKRQVRAALDSIAEKPRVVLDFSAVTFIDSTILNELTRLHKERDAGALQPAVLVLTNANVSRVLRIVRMDELFTIVSTLDDALGKSGESNAVIYVDSFSESEASLSAGA